MIELGCRRFFYQGDVCILKIEICVYDSINYFPNEGVILLERVQNNGRFLDKLVMIQA